MFHQNNFSQEIINEKNLTYTFIIQHNNRNKHKICFCYRITFKSIILSKTITTRNKSIIFFKLSKMESCFNDKIKKSDIVKRLKKKHLFSIHLFRHL